MEQSNELQSNYCGIGIEDLPDEAQRALASGGEWKSEHYDNDSWYASYCDDCDTYHQYRLDTLIRVEDGKVYDVFYSVDSDGDAGDPDYIEWGEPVPAYYSSEFQEQQNRAYYEWVARTGDDVLGWINLPRHSTAKRRQVWQFNIDTSILGPRVNACRPNGRGQRLYREDVPEAVRSYFCTDERGICDPELIHSFGELVELIEADRNFIRWQRTRTKSPQSHRMGLIWIEMPPKPPSEATIRKLAKQAAREVMSRELAL